MLFWGTPTCLKYLVGVAEVAGAADISQREIEFVTIVVARRTEFIFAVFHADSAAVPVVGGLDRAVLHGPQIEVDAGIRRRAEARPGGLSEAEESAHLVEVRHRRQDAIDVRARGSVQPGITRSGEEVALVYIHVEVVCRELPQTRLGLSGQAGQCGRGAGVVVEVPLDVRLLGGADAQARGHRRNIARSGEEGDAGKVERGLEDAARAIEDDGSAEGLVEEIFLGHAPTDPLAVAAYWLGRVTSASRFAGILRGVGVLAGGPQKLGCVGRGSNRTTWPIAGAAQKQPLGYAILHLVGVAGDIDCVESQCTGEVPRSEEHTSELQSRQY